jgi:hypothetical protein
VIDQNLVGQDFRALLMGDVSGDWLPTGPNGPQGPGEGGNAVQASLPVTEAAAGASVAVPFRLAALGGQGVTSYQFDVQYDPTVIAPQPEAVDLTGTNAANLLVVYNVIQPGLLKVAVYGAVPANGDGVYANLKFTVTGAAGSSTPLALQGFMVNGPAIPILTQDGRLTVSGPVANGTLTGRVLTAVGKRVVNATVVAKIAGGNRVTTVTDATGRFTFNGLTIGGVYNVSVTATGLVFRPQSVSIVDGVTEITIIAEP